MLPHTGYDVDDDDEDYDGYNDVPCKGYNPHAMLLFIDFPSSFFVGLSLCFDTLAGDSGNVKYISFIDQQYQKS